MTPRNLLPLVVLLASLAACQHSVPPSPVTVSPRLGYVLSSSMEPTIAGPVRWVHCSNCSIDWALALSSLDPARVPRCPDCYAHGVWGRDEPARLVTIHPVTPPELHVGDVVEFTDPNTEQPTVKRIVGLPGDEVRLQQGDLFVNDQRYRKGRQFLHQAILVHATAWPGPSPWIRCNPSDERPTTLPNSFAFQVPPPAHHGSDAIPHSPSSNSELRLPTPIQDDWWFNHGESLTPVEVLDIGSLFFFRSFQSLDLVLDLEHPTHPFRVRVQSIPNPSIPNPSQWSVTVDIHLNAPFQGNPWAHHELTMDLSSPSLKSPWILIAHVDDQALIAFPTETITESFSDESTTPRSTQRPALPPIVYWLEDVEQLLETWVVRDAYLRLSPRTTEGMLCAKDQAQGLTLLGDNVGVSFDSRQTWPQGVLVDRVLGRLEPPESDLECLSRQRSLRYAE